MHSFYIPSPDINAFNLGPLQIKFYSVTMLLAIVVATVYTARRLTKRGGHEDAMFYFLVSAVFFGIVGARLYHVITHWDEFFYEGANPLEVFAIWNGGIAIFGALLGGALGVFLASRLTGVRFWSLADALVPGLLLAQAIGRIGNYFNQELFGSPTTLPWGLEIDPGNPALPVGAPAGVYFHPVFLYEILWNLLGLAVLLTLEKKLQPRWGKFFGMYLIWYGLGRMALEGIRLDPSYEFFGLRTNGLTALAAILLGVLIIFIQSRRHTGREISVYRDGADRPGKSTLKDTADGEKYHHILNHPEVSNVSAHETMDSMNQKV
ncbi:prolipoprotein diacylglyceryl transferase [Canibacter zhoujuaniae]|uniref:prolipoprotein diacylglyceryl transferase n=1 Tax=Canibacter zhoujuaniae TaxID=2708343 RepID=UPI00141F6710|nr:prolipoprotein diacylglyceryl transferase [Canibacter zhoujuaniae]